MPLKASSRNFTVNRSLGVLVVCFALSTALGACQTTSRGVNPQLAANNVSVTAPVGVPQAKKKPSAFGQYLAGRHAMNSRDPKAAAAFLSVTLDQEPDNIVLIGQAFIANLSVGQIDTAEALAQRLIDKGQENATARLVLAAQALKADKPKDAQKHLSKIQDVSLFALLGPMLRSWTTLEATQDTAKALKELEPLKGKRGLDTLYQMHAGLILDVAGKEKEAEKYYNNSHSADYATSLRFAQMIGNYYERSGRPERAAAVYRQYKEEDPDSVHFEQDLERVTSGRIPPRIVNDSRQGFAEALFDIASVLQQERAADLALIYAQISLSMRRDLTLTKMVLGNLMELQDRHQEAIAMYQSVTPDDSFYWSAQLRIADNLEYSGQTEEAIDKLEGLAGLKPKRWDALTRIGNLHHGYERFEEAAKAFDRAIGRIQTLEERHWGLLYARGRSLERAKEWDRAEKDFLQALELEPEQPYVLNYLGYSWIEQGMHFDKARKMIERAVEQRPNDGYIVDSLGWVLYKLKDYENAVIHLERAVELRPQDPIINDHLGDAYWMVGRRNEARFQWNRSLSLEPEEDLIETIESKITNGLAESVAAE